MKENGKLIGNWETISVCTSEKLKDICKKDEQDVLSDFIKLDFFDNPCNDPSNIINYNEGKEADAFDKIAKYYGRKKNVFLFISLLANEEFCKKIVDVISKKCDNIHQAKFIERAYLYLARIKQGQIDAKEFLNNDDLPDAFFNGYHFGENINIHANLNVNFTQPTVSLEIGNIFKKEYHRMQKENSSLQRIKVYDNGRRSVTIENQQEQRNYIFTSNSSCQLVVNRLLKSENYTIFLDIISGELVNVEVKINGKTADPRKVFDLSLDNEAILIKQKSFYEVLHKYFQEGNDIKDYCLEQDECLPIKTLEGLYKWKPSTHKHITECLRKRKQSDYQPKTLMCHDMKGGYLEDRFVNGTKGEDNYFFLHWSAVDIFVYFSHHFITIPPCSWISAAHRNGVKVLGTFITEWEEGTKICEEFLRDKKSVYQLGMQLVNIAVHHNFDGWLINIENKLKTSQIPLLKKFVSFLTSRMHLFCPGSQIIWYDSVIKNGELKWQNALNDSNRIFFNSCDGIFLNYNWNEENLKQSMDVAGSRKTDVYVGVDVFGRGCLGGGGFSTDVAVTEARKFGLSVAIFAPGWVHECLEVKDFKENQFKFWNALQTFSPPRTLEELPYYSSFCPGFGKKMFRNGKIISDEPWYNASLQHPQPIYSSSENGSVTLWDTNAYNGGGSICLRGKMITEGSFLDIEILKTSFELENVNIISYTFMSDFSTEVILVLGMISNGEEYNLHLVGSDSKMLGDCNTGKSIAPSTEGEILETGYKLKEKIVEDKKEMWTTRTYVLKTVCKQIIQHVFVKLTCADSSVTSTSALLGELEIKPLHPRYDFTYRDLICKSDSTAQNLKVQCLLQWKWHPSISCSDLYFQTACEGKQYICTTSQCSYKLEQIVKCVDEMEIVLCPHSVGSESHPSVTLQIPLEN